MAFGAGLGAVLLLVGRILFGGLFAFMGLNHFTNAEEMTGYTKALGVPAAGFFNAAAGVMLVLGGLGILLGVYPVIAAGMLAVFLLVVTPVAHDFWAAPDDQQQQEMTDFMKNIELLAASLVFLVLGGETWAYALNIGM